MAPRTALGVTSLGALLLLTVDGADAAKYGRRASGMTLAELSHAMADLGAWEAINLDGGGSTSASALGKVANEPTCLDLPGVICERAVTSTVCVST